MSNKLQCSFVDELYQMLFFTTEFMKLIVIQTSAIFCWIQFTCCRGLGNLHTLRMGNGLSVNELKHLTQHILSDQLSVSWPNHTWQVNSCTSHIKFSLKQFICHFKLIFIFVSSFPLVNEIQLYWKVTCPSNFYTTTSLFTQAGEISADYRTFGIFCCSLFSLKLQERGEV